jgi:hypothetical protein
MRCKDHGFVSDNDFCQRLGFSLVFILWGCEASCRAMVRFTTPLTELVSCVIGLSGVSFCLVARLSFVDNVSCCPGSCDNSCTDIYGVWVKSSGV